MYRLRSSKVVIGVVSAVFALMLAFPLPAAAQDDDDSPGGETAAELLIDGMDAAADHAVDSARRLFQKVISAFPSSPEASRARTALSSLDNDSFNEDRAAIQADEAERTGEYRHAFLINAGDRVFFAESSATLGGRARSIIENQARWLKARPNLTVTVIGRADDGGDRRAAQALSAQRAEIVRDELIAAGLDPRRIALRPTGNDDKVAVCASAMCRAQNRTAEVFINDLRDQERMRSSFREPVARTSKTSMDSTADRGQLAQ